MKSRAFALLPLVAAAAFLLTRPLAATHLELYYFVEVLLLKTLALVGCLVAWSGFVPGDRLRAAWLFFAIDFALLISKDLITSQVAPQLGQLLGPKLTDVLHTTFMLGANIAGSVAWIILARTVRAAGLSLDGSPLLKRFVVTGALLLALVLVGWGTGRDVMALLGGESEAVPRVISNTADVIGFAMIAPIALMAWTFRGGRLFWPYLYLTACTFSWMLFDMTESLGPQLGLGPVERRTLVELFRCIACGLHFAAGLAQRWALAAHRVRPPTAVRA